MQCLPCFGCLIPFYDLIKKIMKTSENFKVLLNYFYSYKKIMHNDY